MKKLILILFICQNYFTFSQDTFSIVAVDTITGEIGSAGASCIDESQIPGGAIIISDVIPGRGAIHTQSYWNTTNQQNAHDRMVEGMSPQQIIDWLVANDAQNNPGVRQYGIIDLNLAGRPRSAGFTGANCLNYKNHIAGRNYCIQGNILLGQQILDSIESRFLRTDGTFAEKMMAALQGANVPGADTRCMSNGTSSLSAFIRIARPFDPIGAFYCDLNVPSVPAGMEPIDSLQTLFDEWLGTVVGVKEEETRNQFTVYPNPAGDFITVSSRKSAVASQQSAVSSRQSAAGGKMPLFIGISGLTGLKLKEIVIDNDQSYPVMIDLQDFPAGIYILTISNEAQTSYNEKLIITR